MICEVCQEEVCRCAGQGPAILDHAPPTDAPYREAGRPFRDVAAGRLPRGRRRFGPLRRGRRWRIGVYWEAGDLRGRGLLFEGDAVLGSIVRSTGERAWDLRVGGAELRAGHRDDRFVCQVAGAQAAARLEEGRAVVDLPQLSVSGAELRRRWLRPGYALLRTPGYLTIGLKPEVVSVDSNIRMDRALGAFLVLVAVELLTIPVARSLLEPRGFSGI